MTTEAKTAEEKKLRLTKTVVEGLALPEKGQKIYWDGYLGGFGVRVTHGGAKTYVAERRVQGKTVRVSLGGHDVLTAEEARKKAIKAFQQMNDKINPNRIKDEERAKGKTLNDVLEDYCLNRKNLLRPKTVAVYRSAITRCLSDWLNKPLNTITEEMVMKKYQQISEMKGPRSNKGGAHAQADQVMRVLKSLLNYASRNFKDATGKRIFVDNPVDKITQEKAWNRPVRRKTAIKDHELKDWMDAVESLTVKETGKTDSTMTDYLLLCLFTGLRKTEAAALKWSEVELKGGGFLTIPAERTKNHEEHCLPLSTYLHKILAARYATRGDSPYVFPGTGKLGYISEPKYSYGKVAKISGVKVTTHDLRRTFTTAAERLKISPYDYKRLVNHKGDVTDGYVVSGPETLREPMQLITDFILREAGRLDSPTGGAKPEESTLVVG